MRSSVSGRIGLFVGLAAALILAQVFLPRPSYSPFWDGVFDAGHAVLFGGVAWAAREILATLHWPRRRVFRDVFAFAVAALAGFLTEVAQIPGPRDADPADGVRDLAGAAAVLLARAAITRGGSPWIVRVALLLASLGSAVVGVWPAIPPTVVHLTRQIELPSLVRLDRPWGRWMISSRTAEIIWERIPGPDGTPVPAARVTYLPVSPYPAFILRGPSPDWTGYTNLAMDIHIPGAESRQVIFHVVDREGVHDYREQFGTARTLSPGWHHMSFAVDTVAVAINGRLMDMSAIQSLVVFVSKPDSAFTIDIANIRLER